ncbi:helix-turn-helix domain-containing protein [Membranihabitans marinus]|uniref:helix-turn-helix domain-containing protein n=1 Tax=Membranihabitans marinus TaxID=1227546 RepID=UPI001F42EE4F|nr:helix-turn-helix domain-containing protein [Membranihabitans marinus]
MNESNITLSDAMKFSKLAEQHNMKLILASIISLLLILFSSLIVRDLGSESIVIDNLALVFVLLMVYFSIRERNFQIKKDWAHILMFIGVIGLQFLANKQLFVPYPEGISLLLVLGYPCWIFWEFKRFDGEDFHGEKELLLNLTTITFALLILHVIKYIGLTFFDYNSDVNFVLFEGILEFIFFLFLTSYFIKNIQNRTENGEAKKDSIRKTPSIDQVELAEMARKLEKSLFESKYFLYSGITLELVVEKTGYSRIQLSKLFNEFYNKNFYQLIGERRIENAIGVMTQNNNITMDSVSDQCGFNSKSTFYKYFKNYTGLTPAAFMQNLQNSGDFGTIQ